MDSFSPLFLMNARLRASHASDRKFPSSYLGFSQKNIALYREWLALELGMYYV